MTDFFIASVEELNCPEVPRPAQSWQSGLADTEVDLLMLCNLESILTGAEWDSVFDQVYINPVCEQGPDGPWIYQVSASLLQELQEISPERVIDCARQWSETDEWTLRDDIALDKIADVLRELICLARAAADEQKSLFIWTLPF